MQFDICSCQFALHYSFSSEAATRQLLFNATQALRPGGFFVGTIPDANMIVYVIPLDIVNIFEELQMEWRFLGRLNSKAYKKNVAQIFHIFFAS